jgi:hypothetical protein
MDLVQRRYQLTLAFLRESLPPPAPVLDLGVDNPLAAEMRQEGYTVHSTPDVDLDFEPESVKGFDVRAVTAFEILEHLVNPFGVLRAIEAPRLYATVPLRLWFATAYRNASDIRDQHFHEFEPWQFDRLLEKAGWELMRTTMWTGPTGKIGFRPLLRRYAPRYYAVEARRK